jgi:hypothetical protein
MGKLAIVLIRGKPAYLNKREFGGIMKNIFWGLILFSFVAGNLICQQTQTTARISIMKQYQANKVKIGESWFTYDSNGALVMVKNTDSTGQTRNVSGFQYSAEGRLIKRSTTCSSCGNNVSYLTYEYTADGKLAKSNKYDVSNSLVEYILFEYENDRVKSFKVYDAGNLFIKYGTCTYNTDTAARADTLYSKEGEELFRIITLNGANGLKKEMQIYKKGTLSMRMVFEYLTDNRLNRLNIFNDKNTLDIYNEFIFENKNSSIDIFDFFVPWEIE